MQGAGFRVQGSVFRVQGFRGFRGYGLGVWKFGYRVEGLGFRTHLVDRSSGGFDAAQHLHVHQVLSSSD